MKKIKIEISKGKNAEWINIVLTLVDAKKVDTRLVTERVKTFEDACNELGESHPCVVAWNEYKNTTMARETNTYTKGITAYLKIQIICAALNEGWQPQFTKDEHRYYPWFSLLTQEEYDDLDEDKKCRVVCRGGDIANAFSGLACAYANNVSSFSNAYYGSQLAFKTRELAEYAGRQFVEIFADFCFMPKDK